MKNFSFLLLIITALLVISSCKKEKNDAIADVFARSLMYNGKVGYSTVHSVVSTTVMSAVTVDIPGGGTVSLYDHDGTGTAFFKDTSMVGMYPNPEPPAAGTYTYHVTFGDGEQKVYTNTLANDFLLPPVIDSLYIMPDGISLRLKWEPVAGAQAYQIRISSGQNQIFPYLELTDHSQLYNERLISQFASYLPGTLTFELRAMKYESEDEKFVQAISYTSASIDM
jgi:hypothetical protein